MSKRIFPSPVESVLGIIDPKGKHREEIGVQGVNYFGTIPHNAAPNAIEEEAIRMLQEYPNHICIADWSVVMVPDNADGSVRYHVSGTLLTDNSGLGNVRIIF